MRLPIAGQLLIGFGLLILICAAVGITGLLGANVVGQRTQVVRDSVRIQEVVAPYLTGIERLAATVFAGAAAGGDPTGFTAARAELDERLAMVGSVLDAASAQDVAETLRTTHARYLDAAERMLDRARNQTEGVKLVVLALEQLPTAVANINQLLRAGNDADRLALAARLDEAVAATVRGATRYVTTLADADRDTAMRHQQDIADIIQSIQAALQGESRQNRGLIRFLERDRNLLRDGLSQLNAADWRSTRRQPRSRPSPPTPS